MTRGHVRAVLAALPVRGWSLELDSALSPRPPPGSLPSCAVVSLLGNDPGYLGFILTFLGKLKMNFPNSLGAPAPGMSLAVPVQCILMRFGRWEEDGCCLSVACFPSTSKVMGMLASSLQLQGCLAAGAHSWAAALKVLRLNSALAALCFSALLGAAAPVLPCRGVTAAVEPGAAPPARRRL